MAKTHTVAQGETLTRIARQYKFSSAMVLYNHPENTEFRQLRPNPDLIFPGDKVVIPDPDAKPLTVSTGSQHVFCLKRETEKLKLKLQNKRGKALQNKKILLSLDGKKIEADIGADGLLEVDLPSGDEKQAILDVFMHPESDEPTHRFELQLGHLDPVETLSGVQARCNMLGFDCGIADGIMGAKTRAGVKAFQAAHGLDVDGVPGPKTKAKLKEVYGC
jgi:LysM repeat protein